jgi:MFS family permease
MRARLFLMLTAINFLDAFITGAYMLIVPLLMVKRGISLSSIGWVFSALPVAFLIFRMFFSSAADSVGFRKFFNINALSNFASALLYTVSASPSSYATAKAVQGVKDAAIWAVNRNAVYEAAEGRNPQMASSTIYFIRALATTIGAGASGLMISRMSFEQTFILLAVISALIFAPAWSSDTARRGHLTLKELFGRLDPRTVEWRVWRVALVMSLYTAASTLAVGFVLPIFLSESGFGYWEVGAILASYTGVGALLIPITLRTNPSMEKVVFVQIFLYLPAVIMIPLTGGNLMVAMVLVMGLGEAVSRIVWEALISQEAIGRENIATIIGFLHVPSNLISIPSYVLAGVLVEKFGYMASFSAAAILFLFYSVTALRNLGECYIKCL